jgi:hypothetical protein
MIIKKEVIMQAIEFETTVQNHIIHIPDSIPNGVAVRVLLLIDDKATLQLENSKEKSFFEQLCLENEHTDDDLALLFERDKDVGRDVVL